MPTDISSVVTVLLLATGINSPANAQSVLYVDANATGPGHDGSDWCHAYLNLQDALAVVTAEQIVRVAGGVHKPDQGEGRISGDRDAAFQLSDGLGLEGGYAGCGEPDPDERDIALHETILSGDLANNDGSGFINYGDNSVHVVTVLGGRTTVSIDGFTLRGGHGVGECDFDFVRPCAGGAVFHDGGRLSIRRCKFTENRAQWGGGLHTQDGTLSLSDCAFVGNSAVFGGGMSNDRGIVTLERCEFEHNTAQWGGGFINEYSESTTMIACVFRENTAFGFALGGGMRNWSSNLTAIDCLFEGNTAIDEVRHGGGLYNAGNTRGHTLDLINCAFVENHAERGGGVYSTPALEAVTTIIDCEFVGNTATEIGGALGTRGPTQTIVLNSRFLENWAGYWGGGMWNSQGSNPLMVNTLFSRNEAIEHGGAVFNHSGAHPLFVNCTIVDNWAGVSGGGVYSISDSNPTLINTIIWGNTDGQGATERAQLFMADSDPVVHYSCIQGWTGEFGGSGNTGLDPLFLDAENGDVRLGSGSPAIDAGVNAALPRDTWDLDDDGDVAEAIPFDLQGWPRFINVLDVPDTGLGTPHVVDMGALEHVSDCNGNGLPDDLDINKGKSHDCNVNGIPDECEPSSDCNGNGICDDQDVLDGRSADCNGDGVPDECQADCNGNKMHDSCDISTGWSNDCNDDGVPDECLDTRLDCNANGLVDACETHDGLTLDGNDNGVPDECEPHILFVSGETTELPNGTTWGNAFDDLQDALAVAENSLGAVKEIWVAKGRYTPAPFGGDRARSFELTSGVGVYGGFTGNETRRDERDISANETVLSGDVNGDDEGGSDDVSKIDNSFHVVMSRETDEYTVLDGFTITGGRASPMTSVDRQRGGGMWNDGIPVLRNLRFEANRAVGDGAGLYNNGRPTLDNCVFEDNESEGWGGGMFNDGIRPTTNASPTLIRCRFFKNSASRGGGMAMTWGDADPVITHCEFVGNVARSLGGGVYNDNNSHPKIVNSLFLGNSATGEFARGGGMTNFNAPLTLINSTFVGNWASGVHGGMSNDVRSLQTVIGCVFWGNGDGNGSGESAQISLPYDGSLAVDYSCVQGLTGKLGGVGNIGSDPLFVDAQGPDGVLGDCPVCS